MLLLPLAACATDLNQESIWPPSDFELRVEEVDFTDTDALTLRRFRVGADGLVVYGVPTSHLVDPQTGTPLPVFGRLSVFRLVPTCTRALARRVYRAGVLELEEAQAPSGRVGAVKAKLNWRAFDRQVEAASSGRVHGAMAEILALVGAHLPEGEQLSTLGVAERKLAPVLRGAPAPRDDPAAALQVHLDLLEQSGEDEHWLLDAFALACSLGHRPQAMRLLSRWRQVRATSDAAAGGEALTAEMLARMLPAAGS